MLHLSRISGPTWGANLHNMRQLCLTKVRTVISYACASWFIDGPEITPGISGKQIKMLESLQHQCLLQVSGAMSGTPSMVLLKELNIQTMEVFLRRLAVAQRARAIEKQQSASAPEHLDPRAAPPFQRHQRGGSCRARRGYRVVAGQARDIRHTLASAGAQSCHRHLCTKARRRDHGRSVEAVPTAPDHIWQSFHRTTASAGGGLGTSESRVLQGPVARSVHHVVALSDRSHRLARISACHSRRSRKGSSLPPMPLSLRCLSLSESFLSPIPFYPHCPSAPGTTPCAGSA